MDKHNTMGINSINSINSIQLGGMELGSVAINSMVNDNNLIQKSNASFSSSRLMGFAEKLKLAHDN